MTSPVQDNLGSLILISGGARSGKSHFAHKLALSLGQKRLFVATAQAWDEEMHTRITTHQEERGDSYETLEEPLNLTDALSTRPPYEVLLIDCLTLWISNHLMIDQLTDQEIRESILAHVQAARRKAQYVILVSNEVGFGIVPEYPLARRFRDLNGTLQQALAAQAQRIYLAVLGQILPLHKLRWEEGEHSL